jgi:hypothetical protein
MDDEFIGYIFRFSQGITDLLQTNLTGVHEVFISKSKTHDWKNIGKSFKATTLIESSSSLSKITEQENDESDNEEEKKEQ